MTNNDYTLSVPFDKRTRLARGWLFLGLSALTVAGLFALLLVLARTPYMQSVIPWADFFHTALVVHVDLSVLVWFIAFGAMLWSLNSQARLVEFGWAAFAIAALGTLVMAVAPFTGESRPLINNYVPVLQQPMFLVGLSLFGLGVALFVLRTLITSPAVGSFRDAAGVLRFVLAAAAITMVFALLAFFWSSVSMPALLSGRMYYEVLFWGGGHVLQFAYTLLAVAAWLWLASASGIALTISPRVIFLFVLLGFLPALATPAAYFLYGVGTPEYIIFFTLQMQYAGGLAAGPLALILAYYWVRSPSALANQRPLRAALLASVLLFSVGGVIGYLIRGVNVTIPAHYHGSIVGVTLAFMGVVYFLLPKLGYGEPNRRWGAIQPWVYGGGQLLHIIGLAWSGGYGVQRKVAGAAQGLDSIERVVAMGLMGFGGLVSIIGGLVFLVVVFGAMRRRS